MIGSVLGTRSANYKISQFIFWAAVVLYVLIN